MNSYKNKQPTASGGSTSIAYLVSQYPTLSMIFVIREVTELRKLGFNINVASINNSDRPPIGLTAIELFEAQNTHYIKAQGVLKALIAHGKTLFLKPYGYMSGLKLAFELGKFDLSRLLKNLFYFTEAVMVGQWMCQIKQTHLHVHLGSQAATVGLFVKATFGFGYSLTVHGSDEFYDVEGQFLSRKIVAADFIVCISHFARSQLMKISLHEHWGKLLVCRLGVDPSVFSPALRLTGTDNVFEIICVGRLTAAKGQQVLVEAFKLLVDQKRAVRLRFVGAGIDNEALQKLVAQLGIGDHVVFEGGVNQDRIRDLYATANCFCMPSFAEGLPIVLMEAMSMGLPCVTTYITGIPELIDHGVTGLLVAPGDVEGLTANLVRLMDDPQLAQRLSIQGRKKVIADYDLQSSVKKLATLLETRVNSRGT